MRRIFVTRSEAAAGVTDHGALSGLLDDDHPQYITEAELEAILAALDLEDPDQIIGLVPSTTEFLCHSDQGDENPNFVDSSKNAHTITNHYPYCGGHEEGVAHAWAPFNYLCSNSGPTAYLSIVPDFDVGTSDFAVECMVWYLQAMTAERAVWHLSDGGANPHGLTLKLNAQSAGLALGVHDGAGGTTWVTAGSVGDYTAPIDGFDYTQAAADGSDGQKFYRHLCVQRAGGNLYLYVDGVKVAGPTANSEDYSTSGGVFYFSGDGTTRGPTRSDEYRISLTQRYRLAGGWTRPAQPHSDSETEIGLLRLAEDHVFVGDSDGTAGQYLVVHSAAADPTVNDDTTLGYRAGVSIWLNTSDATIFLCKNHADGAAVWERIDSDRVVDVLRFNVGGTVTISGGVASLSKSYHKIQSESGTTDDLDTLSGTAGGDFYALQAAAGHTITIKHGTGAIKTSSGNDIELSGDKIVYFYLNGTEPVALDVTEGPETSLSPYFHGQDAGGTSIAHSTVTKLQIDTVNVDDVSGWDGSNYRWTPGVAGWYHVHASVQGGSMRYSAPRIYVNGAEYDLNQYHNGSWGGADSTSSGGLSGYVYLDGDDYIELWGIQWNGSSAARTLNGSLSLFLIKAD